MAGTIRRQQTSVSGQGRRRARQPVPRTRRVEFTLNGEEYALLVEAARRAGMARRAYVATVVLAAAANGPATSGQDPLELVLIELMRAAGLVRRIATNLNQAVAKLNATGQPAGDLPALRRREHPPRRPHRRGSRRRTQSPAVTGHGGGDRVIGKISTPRGEHVQPLLYYLFGPGRQEEHTDPHIVAGWRHPADLEPPLRPDGKRDFAKLAGLLLQPQAALGKRAHARPVWHCSMRAAPGRPDAVRRRMGRYRARGDAPHRAVSLRPGRRGRPLGRCPARR